MFGVSNPFAFIHHKTIINVIGSIPITGTSRIQTKFMTKGFIIHEYHPFSLFIMASAGTHESNIKSLNLFPYGIKRWT